jgi:hypothetical protein
VDADAALTRFAQGLPEVPTLSSLELRTPVTYRGYSELMQAWGALTNLRTRMIGRSVGGEPLWMCEVGNPSARRATVVLAGIHPIEWIGVETALALASLHDESPCEDRRVCFVPLVNVDGFKRVEASLRSGRRKWIRSNDNKVDLNRNWPTNFRRRKGLIAGHNSSGPTPCSEPEVAAICETLDEISQHTTIDLALSLHSIGKKVLYPFGGRWSQPRDGGRQAHLAHALQRILPPGYSVDQCARWVPGAFAYGMEIDHLHAAYGANALLVECTRGDLCWRRPRAFLDPFRIFNPGHGRSEAGQLAHALDRFVRDQL